MTEQDQERVEEVKFQIYEILSDYAHAREIAFADGKGIAPRYWVAQILSLKDKNGKPMIAIISDDQSLPKIESHPGHNLCLLDTQQDMLASNFRRVIEE